MAMPVDSALLLIVNPMATTACTMTMIPNRTALFSIRPFLAAFSESPDVFPLRDNDLVNNDYPVFVENQRPYIYPFFGWSLPYGL